MSDFTDAAGDSTNGRSDQPNPDFARQNPPARAPMPSMPDQQGSQEVGVASGYLFKERSPVMTWLVFPIITLGIYHLVWYYKIHKEMADFDRRRQAPVAGPLLVLIFLSWTVIAPLVSYYNTGQRIQNAQRAAGLHPTCTPILACLLTFVFGLNILYMQTELNKIVDRYGGAQEGKVIPLFV